MDEEKVGKDKNVKKKPLKNLIEKQAAKEARNAEKKSTSKLLNNII